MEERRAHPAQGAPSTTSHVQLIFGLFVAVHGACRLEAQAVQQRPTNATTTRTLHLNQPTAGAAQMGATSNALGPSTFRPWRLDSNPSVVGATFGSSWGDMDADGDPDLFLNMHYVGALPRLLRNQGGGDFIDIADQIIDDPSLFAGDRHTGTWSDIDADGRQDLMITYGADYGTGSGPNRVFHFQSRIPVDYAPWYGLDAPLARSRAFHAFDWDGDGGTDYFLSAMPRPDGRSPRTLFLNVGMRHDPAFLDCAGALQLPIGTSYYTQTVPLPDGSIGFWMHGFPGQMFRFGTFPAEDRTAALGLSGIHWMTDSAFADFDGDGDFDLFCSTARERSGAELNAGGAVEACLIVNGDEHGVDLRSSTGGLPVAFELRGYPTPSEIYIGSTGTHPTYLNFTLDPNDASTHGLAGHVAGNDRGVYVGFDAATGRWQLRASSSTFYRATIVARSASGMLAPDAIGFDPNAVGIPDRLLLWDNGRFVQAPPDCGFGAPTDAMSCAAADFDNDGDVDLYLVCTGAVSNRPNAYFRNRGDGKFLRIADADGAPGSDAGRGDTVSTADFDGDGFVDLCVTNGEGTTPFFDDGPVELFRSNPNGYHWLILDLSSTTLNADAWGTRVTAWVGTQRIDRWQDGGSHRFSQDDSRIHLGLGQASRVDLLRITWADGQVDDHIDVPVDRVLRIVRR